MHTHSSPLARFNWAETSCDKGCPTAAECWGGSDFHENPRKVTVTSRRTKNRNYSCVTHGTVDEVSGGDDETDREKNELKKISNAYRNTNILRFYSFTVRRRPMY